MAIPKYRLPPREQEILKRDETFCKLKATPYRGIKMEDDSALNIPRFTGSGDQSQLSLAFIQPATVDKLKEVCFVEQEWGCINADDQNLRKDIAEWVASIPEKLLRGEVFNKFLDGNAAAFALCFPHIVQRLYAKCGSDFHHPNFQMWFHHPPRTLVRPVHGSVYFISTAHSDLSPSMCKGGSRFKWKASGAAQHLKVSLPLPPFTGGPMESPPILHYVPYECTQPAQYRSGAAPGQQEWEKSFVMRVYTLHSPSCLCRYCTIVKTGGKAEGNGEGMDQPNANEKVFDEGCGMAALVQVKSMFDLAYYLVHPLFSSAARHDELGQILDYERSKGQNSLQCNSLPPTPRLSNTASAPSPLSPIWCNPKRNLSEHILYQEAGKKSPKGKENTNPSAFSSSSSSSSSSNISVFNSSMSRRFGVRKPLKVLGPSHPSPRSRQGSPKSKVSPGRWRRNVQEQKRCPPPMELIVCSNFNLPSAPDVSAAHGAVAPYSPEDTSSDTRSSFSSCDTRASIFSEFTSHEESSSWGQTYTSHSSPGSAILPTAALPSPLHPPLLPPFKAVALSPCSMLNVLQTRTRTSTSIPTRLYLRTGSSSVTSPLPSLLHSLPFLPTFFLSWSSRLTARQGGRS
eukprot:752046-Hanusia_phi.AAC.1